jgi:hypothetical protein
MLSILKNPLCTTIGSRTSVTFLAGIGTCKDIHSRARRVRPLLPAPAWPLSSPPKVGEGDAAGL